MARNDTMIDRPASKRVGALRGLMPFLRPYRSMSALAGILIGMGYGAVRAVVRRARARRRAPGSDAATDPAGPTS